MDQIKLQDLTIFRTVFELGNSKACAAKLNLSETKVSRSLNDLRKAYGDSLFIRKRQGFIPTPKSKQLYEDVVKALDLLTAHKPIDQYDKQVITIGISATLSVGLLEYLNDGLKEIRDAFTIQIQPQQLQACKKVAAGELDIAIAHRKCQSMQECLNKNKASVDFQHLGFGQGLFVIANDSHPLWEQAICLDSIAQYPFVVTQIDGFNERVDPMQVFAEAAGKPFKVSHRVTNLASLIECLLTTDGISFIGTRCAAEFLDRLQGVRAMRLSDTEYQRLHSYAPPPHYTIIHRNDPLTETLKDAVIDFVHAQIQ